MNLDFNGKTVLVTGGASGIGRAACLAFAAAGARIACVDSNVANGEALNAELIGAGAPALFINADVTDAEQVRLYVQQVLARFARIDVFINNAGIEGNVQPLVNTAKMYSIASWR